MYKSDERAHDRKMAERLVREEEGIKIEAHEPEEDKFFRRDPDQEKNISQFMKEFPIVIKCLRGGGIKQTKEAIEAIENTLGKIKQDIARFEFERNEVVIDSTAKFDQALEVGCLKEAEEWFEKAKEMERYNDKWIDHQERKLFQAYYEMKDWVNAKRIVEGSVWASSKEGRKRRLEELSGMQYEEINSSE